MARKFKIGLDYFPHVCHYDDSLKYIVAKHKSEGYHVYYEFLRGIYKKYGYYMECNEKNLFILSSETGVSIDKLRMIINDCISENLFNKSKFEDYNILTSLNIQEIYFDIIGKRKTATIIEEFILLGDKHLKELKLNINIINKEK